MLSRMIRRIVAAVAALLLAAVGLGLAFVLSTQDRSACEVGGGGCIVGPTYAILHPGPGGFDHVFGAVVVLASVLIPLAAAAYIVRRYTLTSRGKGN